MSLLFLIFLIFLDIFLASVEALGRICPLTPWEGEQACGLHWQRLFRGMETRSSKARSSKSESWLGFFPVNPLLMYSKGRSVQMCLALQLFILVGCTWKVDKGWKRGCNFFQHTHMRNTTPKALSTWNSDKNKACMWKRHKTAGVCRQWAKWSKCRVWQALFEKLGIYTKEETEARQEVMLENYITSLKIEVLLSCAHHGRAGSAGLAGLAGYSML